MRNNIQTILWVYFGCWFISTKWMLFKATILTNSKLTTHSLSIYKHIEINIQRLWWRVQNYQINNKRGTKIKIDDEIRTRPHYNMCNYTNYIFSGFDRTPIPLREQEDLLNTGLFNPNYSVLKYLWSVEWYTDNSHDEKERRDGTTWINHQMLKGFMPFIIKFKSPPL